MVPVTNTLGFLLGRWSIDRVITDQRGGRGTRFSGVAAVEAVAGGARYLERGRVTHGAHDGPARRELGFTARADGTVRMAFSDGRPFVDLDLGTGTCTAVHPCRADTYEMTFEVLHADRIRELWRVSGPDKDYAAETVWQRRCG